MRFFPTPIKRLVTTSSVTQALIPTTAQVQAEQEVVPRLFDRASGRQLPLEYLRCLFYIDFSLCEMPRRMMAHASMGELLSLLQHYFTESPAVISEVETMFREKGIGISLPKEHPSQAAL